MKTQHFLARVRPWAAWLLLALSLGFMFGIARGQVTSAFDHLRTGYRLTGVHNTVRCEDCHIGGVFKGTPRECDSCHTSGAKFARTNVVKSGTHIPTTQTCDTCHTTRTFSGAKMDHATVAQGGCATCHNGVQASGKPTEHFPTSASCDGCHRTAGWRPVSGFTHAGVVAGTCANCHNGVKGSARPATHVPYQNVASLASASCDSCHKAGFVAWTPAKLHTNVTVTAQCATCHASAPSRTTRCTAARPSAKPATSPPARGAAPRSITRFTRWPPTAPAAITARPQLARTRRTFPLAQPTA